MTKTIIIEYHDRVEDEDGNWIYGKVHYDGPKATIYTSTNDANGKKLNDDVIECTVRHELFHAILDMMYFNDLSANETLVEWLANTTLLLHKQGITI